MTGFEILALKTLVGTMWDIANDDDNNLTGDDIKKAVLKNLGVGNDDAKGLISSIANEINKKL